MLKLCLPLVHYPYVLIVNRHFKIGNSLLTNSCYPSRSEIWETIKASHMNKKVSLKDIAQKVGVSTALVSYVLNNKKQGRISKAVAQKIRDAALQMNYRANQIAKSLKTNKTQTIGLIVADIANPFFSGLARIIEDEADKTNYTVIFGSSDENAEKSLKLIDTFINRQVDGLILAAGENGEGHIKYLQQQEVPLVLIDRYFPGINNSYIALDNYMASRQAVNHFVTRGFSRIGMIGYKSSSVHLKERVDGYFDALKENNIPFSESWFRDVSITDLTNEVFREVDFLVNDIKVDSILFESNVIAVAGLKRIHSMGIRVPSEIGLISFDETEAFDLFYAPLTYIRQPLKEMGRMAMEVLLKTIEKDQTITQVKLPGELVVRAST